MSPITPIIYMYNITIYTTISVVQYLLTLYTCVLSDYRISCDSITVVLSRDKIPCII